MRKRPTSPCTYPCCPDWAWAQGYCDRHYQKLKRHGVIQKQRVMKNDVARFHTKYRINEETGCWEWTGSIHPRGYAMIGITVDGKGQSWRANRFAYSRLVGPIPEGQQVLHRCDNRRCANPEHLFLGDDFDNMRDCVAKGWHAQNGKTGHKITKAMVQNIRVMYARGLPLGFMNRPNPFSIRNLAAIYQVEDETIRQIVKGGAHLDVG